MKTKISIMVIAVMVLCLFSVSLAGIPKLINYQGKLTKVGTCSLDTTISMTFKIYNDTTGGNLQWSETQNGVQVQDGLFNVILGRVTALNLPFNQQYWLEVQVGSDTMPRLRFTSVGYAYQSLEADTADYARAFSGTVENADKVDGIHASSTPTASYLYPLDGSAKIPNSVLYTGSGNGLDADLLDGHHSGEFSPSGHNHDAAYTNDGAGEINATNDFNFTSATFITNLDADKLDGQDASAFLTVATDYGRSGVAADLYEGASTLTSKYVNEGQTNSITSTMIQDLQIVDADIANGANINPSKISGTAWTSNNDGGGSGLDADLLDGQHASAFSLTGHDHDADYIDDGGGEINATNDFNFLSSTFITNLDADKLDGQHASAFLTTATDYGRSGVAGDLYEGTSTLTSKYVNEGQGNSITSSMIQDYQIVDMDISNSANIAPSKIQGTAWTSNNDGSGSGLDADLLDGKHAAQFVDGSGGTSYVPKFTAPSTIGNSVIYETGGNIGIGTIAPTQRLDVNGNASITGNAGIGTASPNTRADINGDIALRSGNFVAVNGNNNNIAIGARSFVIITGPGVAFTITGIAGGQDGKIVILYNTTGVNMTIANLSGLSAPGNQILTMSGANQSTVATGNVTFIYDATSSVWIMTAINP